MERDTKNNLAFVALTCLIIGGLYYGYPKIKFQRTTMKIRSYVSDEGPMGLYPTTKNIIDSAGRVRGILADSGYTDFDLKLIIEKRGLAIGDRWNFYKVQLTVGKESWKYERRLQSDFEGSDLEAMEEKGFIIEGNWD